MNKFLGYAFAVAMAYATFIVIIFSAIYVIKLFVAFITLDVSILFISWLTVRVIFVGAACLTAAFMVSPEAKEVVDGFIQGYEKTKND